MQSSEGMTLPAGSQASEAFNRLKKLSGRWVCRSTKGWTEESSINVIAGESVVRSSSFGTHPNETMLTLFHMDGDRLNLTHYSVARNQPSMAATRFGDDGKTI